LINTSLKGIIAALFFGEHVFANILKIWLVIAP